MQRKAYAFFDFDGTLIKGDSIIRFVLYARRKGLCSTKQLLVAAWMGVKYRIGLTTAEKSKQAAMGFLAGRHHKEVDKLARDFCHEVLIPNLYPEGVEAIRRHRLEGTEVWMVSASTASAVSMMLMTFTMVITLYIWIIFQRGIQESLHC